MKNRMMALGLLALPLFALPMVAQGAEGASRQLTLPSGQILMVNEGRGEPASIGSYDVRLYTGANPQFPLDQFVEGKVLPREGSIKELKLLDLNGDKQPELVVIMESAGSGSYLSGDAFTIGPQGELELFHQIRDLPPGEDIIKALKSPQD